MICEPTTITERVPSLSALKAAVMGMQADFAQVDREAEALFSRVRLINQKLVIVCEVMDQLLGDPPLCPDGTYPELNHKDRDEPSA